VPVVKRKHRGSKPGVAAIQSKIEAVEKQMRNPPPGSGFAGLGGMQRYKEADYDAMRGPKDAAHRAFRMPKDYRSRGFLEMYSGEGPLDDANDHDPPERKRRFKSAAKSGAHCGDDQAGHCGRPLKPDEPVWLIRRRYTRDHYDSDDVVAPICWKC